MQYPVVCHSICQHNTNICSNVSIDADIHPICVSCKVFKKGIILAISQNMHSARVDLGCRRR